MDTTELEERFKILSEEYRKDENEISQMYEDAVEEVEEAALVELSDDEKREYAISLVRSDLIEETSYIGGEEVDVLAIGHGSVQRWVDSNDDDYVPFEDSSISDYREWKNEQPKKQVLLANGIIETNDGLGLASFILDETHEIDLGKAMEMFTPLTAFKGVFSFRESENLQRGYVANSTPDTEFLLEEVDNIPESNTERLSVIRKFVDEISLANVLEGLSLTSSWEGGNSPADFGIDVKRIEANVVDYYVSDDENKSSVYTILDSSVASASELEGSPVHDEDRRPIGLTCWTPTEMMEYGNGSRCEFYGVVEQNNDGRIVMNTRGIVPLMPRPMEDGSSDENVERESI